MWSLACSLADGVLANAILIPPHPTIPPTNIRKVRSPRKKYGNQEKKRVGMAKRFLQSMETRDELSTTLYLQAK